MNKYAGYYVEYERLFKDPDTLFDWYARTNALEAYKWFTREGWGLSQTAAIIACMCMSSTMNPWLLPQGVRFDDPTSMGSNVGGMGLMQWQPGYTMYQWCMQNGLDPRAGNVSCLLIEEDYLNAREWTPILLYPSWNQFRSSAEKAEVLAPVFWQCYGHHTVIPLKLPKLAKFLEEQLPRGLLMPAEIAIMAAGNTERIGGQA